jgi:hypothetical protein
MSFFALPRSFGESGSVVFSDVIEILESDDRVTLRRMNPDGGFYPTEEMVYDDDSNSFDLGNNDGMSFIDALEDEIGLDDLIGDKSSIDLLQNSRYVPMGVCTLYRTTTILTFYTLTFDFIRFCKKA